MRNRRKYALSPPQMWSLDADCARIAEAFGHRPYLVGSAVEGPHYRDVDVRLILPDEEWAKLDDGPRIFLGLVVSEWLSHRTGLPIDFQLQQQTAANLNHDKPRNPLGVRSLFSFKGDWGTRPSPEEGIPSHFTDPALD